MDWAVDTTYLIIDASSDVRSVRSSRHRPGHRHHNQTVLVKWCSRHTRVWLELAPLSLVLQATNSAFFEFGDGTAAGSSPLTPVPCQGFKLIGRDAARLEIGLEAVLEPLELSTNAACTVSQLSVQRSLWYSVVLHAYYMAGPSKLRCHEESLDATDLTTFEYIGVGSHFLPFDIGYFPQTSQVELVELQYMTSVQSPWLAAIQQSCADDSSVDSDLGWQADPMIIP